MKLVILDRDGVINRDSDAYVKSADEWLPLPGSIAAISELCNAGFTVAVATNQSGIARGLFSQATLAAIHGKMTGLITEAGGHIAHIAICPHGPGDECACRKPQPGLIDQIVQALEVPVSAERWLVGDSVRDLLAGEARGFQTVLVRTGNGESTLERNRDEIPSGTLIADDLATAARLVIGAAARKDCDAHG